MYYKGDVNTTKVVRPTHVVIGADEYFIQNSSKVIPNNGIVNFYIVYKLLPKNISTDNALKNCLFGAVDATRADNRVTDPDKFTYSGYRFGFDHTGIFTHPKGGIARNVIIFEADMSDSVHASNKAQNILVLGKAFIQKINNTTIYAEKMYSPNFSVEIKIFVLSLHYNGDILFVNGQKVTQFKAKNSVIKNNAGVITLGSLTRAYSSSTIGRFLSKNINDIKM